MSSNVPNDNIFFDGNLPEEVDSTPIDLSNLTKAEILPDNTVMLRLEIQSPGFQKQFASSEIVDDRKDIDCTLVKTSKSLIDKRYLDPVTRLDSRMRSDLYQIGMRPKFLGQGNVIVPLKLLHYTIRRLDNYKAEREILVQQLVENYEEAKAEAKRRNPDLYREQEYPTVDVIREKFSVSYNIFSVAFPDIIDRIEAGVVTEIGEKVTASLNAQKAIQQKQLEEGVEEIMTGLRAGFYELVTNLEDKVRGIGTERKVFTPGFVASFRTFLETFDAKNIMNDQELAGMVNRVRSVLSGVSPDSIRNNLEVKIKLESELGAIKDNLSNLTQKATRKASFA